MTAAALFDGHDASINIMRRILQSGGAEVIHLGHNRSVAEVVTAAIQEDAHGIAVSSYQGGHVRILQIHDRPAARARRQGHIKVFGGGGGVIVPEEIQGAARLRRDPDLRPRGRPDDGPAGHDRRHAGQGGRRPDQRAAENLDRQDARDPTGATLARCHYRRSRRQVPRRGARGARSRPGRTERDLPPVLGITGTGGAGKSSVTDEIVRRFRLDRPELVRIAVLAIDPSRRKKTGGALLGDRIRMNASINDRAVYMRSLATRVSGSEIAEALPEAITACKAGGLRPDHRRDLGHRPGRRGDRAPTWMRRLYVMTPEFGAATPAREDRHARFRRRSSPSTSSIARAPRMPCATCASSYQRNQQAVRSATPDQMPVFGTVAVPLQRRRGHGAVCRPARGAAPEGLGGMDLRPAAQRRQDAFGRGGHHPGRPHPLSRRSGRVRARLSRHHRQTGGAGARAPAVAGGAQDAGQEGQGCGRAGRLDRRARQPDRPGARASSSTSGR